MKPSADLRLRRFLVVFTLLFAACAAPARAQTLVVVRHAEKEKNGDKDNPPLSRQGRERARLLAQTLESLHVNRIIVSEKLRAAQTAAPLAGLVHVEPEAPKAAEHDAPVKELAELLNHALKGRDVVLLVTHHHKMEELLKDLTDGKDVPTIDEFKEQYDDLFVLKKLDPASAKWSMVHLRYGESSEGKAEKETAPPEKEPKEKGHKREKAAAGADGR